MLITLTSDFGLVDGYVGVLKAVILSIAPQAAIVDISHNIPAWDIRSANWVLRNSCHYFPAGTIHVAVVDPGVGSARRPILLKGRQGIFIGPDNGIFSFVAEEDETMEAFELTESKFWLPEVSSSFHGRDIFAPVAAHLSCGVTPAETGKRIESASLVKLSTRNLTRSCRQVAGAVVYVDYFGNLITNLPAAAIEGGIECKVGDVVVAGPGVSYSSVAPGTLSAFVGSHGFLEVAVCQGRADKVLKAGVGTKVSVALRDEVV